MTESFENKLQATEAYYRRSLDALLYYAKTFIFDGTHPLHISTVSLYGSILELCGSLIPLLETEHFSTIPVVLRSILEAYVDLENLCKEPTYGYSLEIKYLTENLKFLKEARNGKNDYLGIISEAPDLEERISLMEVEKNRLLTLGYKDLNKFERFSKAGLENEYKTVYNWLCCASHNDYRALRERHLEPCEQGLTIYYFKEADYQELETLFGTASELLLRASFAIHTLLKSEKMTELTHFRQELDELRGDV
ncbi:MAG: hypothetical protein A2076_11670 [Geobacteraceae bacterium GWC2_53_11]|nr:MAG: hypothetical protein A2076_11670 [Geobacteraceae bacterium GWC2_53_11]